MRLSTGERKVLTPGVKSYVTPMGHLCWGVGFGGRGAGHLHPGGRRDYLAGCVGRRAAAGCTVNTNPKGLGASEATVLSWLSCTAKDPRAVSSVGSERLVYTQEVTGSNPVPPIAGRSGIKRLLGETASSRSPPPFPIASRCIPPEDCRGEVRFGSGQPWWQAAGQAVREPTPVATPPHDKPS